MKKKLVSVLLSAAMTATLLAGCGGAADTAADTGAAEATEEAGAEEAAADEVEEAVEEETPTATFGDSSGTHLEMWTFVELHGQHYQDMAEVWNEQHPDETIEITCTTYPYGDMHTKLLSSLEAGTGEQHQKECAQRVENGGTRAFAMRHADIEEEIVERGVH